MDEKSVFFTSDLHIGHENSIKFDGRPFRDLDHMHESLITRYNATVKENGVCFFLGDVGTKTEAIHKVLSRMNGTKILILGNHDKGMFTMYNAGFDVVLHNATIYVGDNKVTMSHCPLLDTYREDTSEISSKMGVVDKNWHGESREKHRRCSVPNEGQFHLHGHIHSHPNKPKSVKILDKQFDVGVVGNDYRPVSLSTITSWINQYNNGLLKK